jgi:alpha-amylase/alpha-mannosidase (GH57 family)/regulator of extracellular matrix RemA (YlzA/DUF370 family)
MATPLVIHGHFYQPPRENPWSEVVDDQPSAAPYANWNERVFYECYRPNAHARVLDLSGRVEAIINNYRYLSFNFGPTLLSWMEKCHPRTYAAILEADRESRKRNGGHGNAIAQAYNHAILPLCNERDRITQVRWGVADFRHRFKRDPESLWLPETACNDATLGTLIDEGLRYVILSPDQAARVRPLAGGDWRDVSSGNIDPGVAYRCFHRDGSGRFIDVFFYDGPIARAIAFEGALQTTQILMDRIGRAQTGEGRIVQTATDGESYGHHTHFGDRSLAYALEFEAPRRGYEVTNYGAFLERNPPRWQVELKGGPGGEGTAWSCAHGVGRWVRDCGCHTGGREGWNQAWRGPLRQALDFARDAAQAAFEQKRGILFQDPWAARDEYVGLILDPARDKKEFLDRHAGRVLTPAERVRALLFLEVQRQAQLMYTSCGWFFADVSGIETVQILKYAGRMFDLMGHLGLDVPKDRFLAILGEAVSNLPVQGTAADLYRQHVEPCAITPQGVAAHLALTSAADGLRERGMAGGLHYVLKDHQTLHHGRLTLTTGHMELESPLTTERNHFAYASLHMGGLDFYGAVKPHSEMPDFARSAKRVWDVFQTASLPQLLRTLQDEFGPQDFGVEHLLPESRRHVFESVFRELVERFYEQYARLYEDNRRNLEMLQTAGFPLPPELRAAAEFTLSRRFEEEIRKQGESRDPEAYQEALQIAEEARQRGYRLDHTFSNRVFSAMVTDSVRMAVEEPAPETVRTALGVLRLARKLNLEFVAEPAQEIVYQAAFRDPRFPLLVELAEALSLRSEILLQKNREMAKEGV